MNVWQAITADRQQVSVSTLMARTTASVMTALLATIGDSLAMVYNNFNTQL